MIYRKTRVRSWRQRSTSQHMETVCKRFPNPNKRHFNSNTISWTTDACDLVDGWVVYSTNNQPSFKPAANMYMLFLQELFQKKSIHLIIPVPKLQNSLETNLTRKKKKHLMNGIQEQMYQGLVVRWQWVVAWARPPPKIHECQPF